MTFAQLADVKFIHSSFYSDLINLLNYFQGLSIDTSINNVQNHCNLVETSACLLAFHCEGT